MDAVGRDGGGGGGCWVLFCVADIADVVDAVDVIDVVKDGVIDDTEEEVTVWGGTGAGLFVFSGKSLEVDKDDTPLF